MPGAFEHIFDSPKTISVTTEYVVEGANEAYKSTGFFVIVDAVTGTWTVDFIFAVGGREFVLASVAGITSQGAVLATKNANLLGKELPSPRPNLVRAVPTSPGSITFAPYFSWS